MKNLNGNIMKKVFYIFMISSAVVACTKNAAINQDEQNLDTVEYISYSVPVSINLPETKVAFSDPAAGKIKMQWVNNDKVKVAYSGGSEGKVDGTIVVSENTATLNYSIPSGTTVSDAWYPAYASKPTAIPRDQVYSHVASIPLHLDQDELNNNSEFVFVPQFNCTILGFKIKGVGNLTSLAVRVDANPYSIKFQSGYPTGGGGNLQVTLNEEGVPFYIVVPVASAASTTSATSSKFDVTFTVDDRSYTRTTKNVALASNKFIKVPDIDIREGAHLWVFNDALNEKEAPLKSWFASQGAGSFVGIEKSAEKWTVTTAGDSSPYRRDIGVLFNGNYSSDGVHISTDAGTKLSLNRGNYPLFAIKMSNPAKLGKANRLTLDAGYFSIADPLTNLDSQGFSYLDGYGATTDGAVVIYYTMPTNNASFPDTKKVDFSIFQLKVADITADSAPSYDVYWAGFFNKTTDIANYDTSGTYYSFY